MGRYRGCPLDSGYGGIEVKKRKTKKPTKKEIIAVAHMLIKMVEGEDSGSNTNSRKK